MHVKKTAVPIGAAVFFVLYSPPSSTCSQKFWGHFLGASAAPVELHAPKMSKPVQPLTQLQVKNAKPKDKPYKLADGGGLYLEVMPTGSKLAFPDHDGHFR